MQLEWCTSSFQFWFFFSILRSIWLCHIFSDYSDRGYVSFCQSEYILILIPCLNLTDRIFTLQPFITRSNEMLTEQIDKNSFTNDGSDVFCGSITFSSFITETSNKSVNNNGVFEVIKYSTHFQWLYFTVLTHINECARMCIFVNVSESLSSL